MVLEMQAVTKLAAAMADRTINCPGEGLADLIQCLKKADKW